MSGKKYGILRKGKGMRKGLKKLGACIRATSGYSSYKNFAFEHDIRRAQFGRYERGQDLRFSSLSKFWTLWILL
jgi:hypothetical protein